MSLIKNLTKDSLKKKPKKKRLLITTDAFLPRWDGIARFLSEIIPRLKDKYELTIIAPDTGLCAFDNDPDITIVRIPLSKLKGGDFASPKFQAKKIRKEVAKADIVFVQTLAAIGFLSIYMAKKLRKKVVCFIHLIEWEIVTKAIGITFFKKFVNVVTKWFARKMYNKADMLIVPSENIAEMLTWQKITANKEVIHLGVDTKKFVPTKNKDASKRRLGIDENTFVIGHHGRIAREKDLPTLLRAFILIKKSHQNVKLLIVGDGLESIKRKLARVEGVILPGSSNNVVPFLQAMDVYCLPSLTETTSLTTLEAMACGVPVVATKVGFVKDYIKRGRNGLFFKEKNSYDLAKKILFLMKHEKLRNDIGKEAHKTVEKEFNWDVTAKKIDEVIEKVS